MIDLVLCCSTQKNADGTELWQAYKEVDGERFEIRPRETYLGLPPTYSSSSETAYTGFI
ncbi:hypothetical protein PSEUDO9AZ_20040 [Pseudomonas sp. 9AZ]|nr:hypothetical protein PSEUDO9AZ_20040 [Pseudomonas sp. 9AZ]